MDLLELKVKIYKRCIEKQKDLLENSKSAMDDAQKAANEYGPPKDRYDSFRTQLLRKRDLYAEQYEKALKEYRHLEILNPEIKNNTVDVNTLVITNIQKFYVSIGLGKIDLPDGIFFVVSPLAPIFQSLRGKKKGESITFKGQHIEVVNVV